MNHSNWNSCIDFTRNEVVFENRNKLYGAYVIRHAYTRNVLFSFVTACLFMGGILAPFLLKPLPLQPNVNLEKFSEIINLEIFTPPPVNIELPSTPQTSSPEISKELTNPVVVEERIATTDVQMLTGAVPQTVLPTDGGDITSQDYSKISMPVISDNVVINWAEIMPKFTGGDEKLVAYLTSQIRYPSKALLNNVEGTVYVSFVVDTSGLIKNVKLMQGISQECDMEAIKGVMNMPKWIPGSQNGNKVSVELSLPVHFSIK